MRFLKMHLVTDNNNIMKFWMNTSVYPYYTSGCLLRNWRSKIISEDNIDFDDHVKTKKICALTHLSKCRPKNTDASAAARQASC